VELKVGDVVDVCVERLEDRQGESVLSRERARREESWLILEQAFQDVQRVEGAINGRVKGGYTVDLSGAIAFLPNSQVDVRPTKDIGPLMGKIQPFQILKMDRRRGNIVVSRRAVLEESRAESRSEIISGLREGQIMNGTVKNITNYGAFVDLGGVDGLVHITDISWRRINHPSEVLSIGQQVDVQVIKYNQENQRISLGIKQLDSNPWDNIESRYAAGQRLEAKITNLTDYGAFAELEPGIEGLIYVSELSWTKKTTPPNRLLTIGQTIEVMILDIDLTKRRISLGYKQCLTNPWELYAAEHQVGEVLTLPIKNITDFGLFVEVAPDMEGIIHLNDLTWDRSGEELLKTFVKGQEIEAKILEIDPSKERVSLGIKQLSEPVAGATSAPPSAPSAKSSSGEPVAPAAKVAKLKKGEVVTAVITQLTDGGVEVRFADNQTGFIKKAELSREKSEQRVDRFAVGEKLDAQIIQYDATGKKTQLSVKQLELDEERKALEAYGTTGSGASLGDIFGAALSKAKEKKAEKTAKLADTSGTDGTGE
jgi:small subunit ribosomal protein S1